MNIMYFAHNGVDHSVTSAPAHTESGQGTVFWAVIISVAAIVLAVMVARQLSKSKQPVAVAQEDSEEE